MEQKLLFRAGRNCIFCDLGLFSDGGLSVSARFHLFVSDVYQGNDEAV